MRAVASIREMVARLEHANECDGEDCDLDAETILSAAGYAITPEHLADTSALETLRDSYHDSDAAREDIQEDALSVEVRSGWHSPGDDSEDEEFAILLTTGGPALRIVGDLGEWGSPKQPRLEMQDWWIPWQEVVLDYEDYAALQSYCECFYFGG